MDPDACGRVRTYQVFIEFRTPDRHLVTACLLVDTGHLLLDRGGPLLASEYVAALLGDYRQFHDGAFELHAEPVGGIDALRAVRDELGEAGLVDEGGDGKGPFAEGLSRAATGLDDAIRRA